MLSDTRMGFVSPLILPLSPRIIVQGIFVSTFSSEIEASKSNEGKRENSIIEYCQRNKELRSRIQMYLWIQS